MFNLCLITLISLLDFLFVVCHSTFIYFGKSFSGLDIAIYLICLVHYCERVNIHFLLWILSLSTFLLLRILENMANNGPNFLFLRIVANKGPNFLAIVYLGLEKRSLPYPSLKTDPAETTGITLNLEITNIIICWLKNKIRTNKI